MAHQAAAARTEEHAAEPASPTRIGTTSWIGSKPPHGVVLVEVDGRGPARFRPSETCRMRERPISRCIGTRDG
jgi:hypothetical protein